MTISNAGEDLKKVDHWYSIAVNIKRYSHSVKSLVFSYKIKHATTTWPSKWTLIYPRGMTTMFTRSPLCERPFIRVKNWKKTDIPQWVSGYTNWAIPMPLNIYHSVIKKNHWYTWPASRELCWIKKSSHKVIYCMIPLM